jgi:putative glutamine amidotransferase
MKIGLTYTGSDEKHSNYVQWLKANEDIDIVRLSADDHNLNEVKNCDAVVFSGGIDMHPKYYHNNKLDYNNAPEQFNEKRDEFELAAFNLALENDKPILGICRGMQLINCALGGDLQQDLNELNNIHKAKGNDKAHGVTILPNTLLYDTIQVERGVINSAHHQAIKNTGKGLLINSISDEGIAEGLEWEDKADKPFLLCVQWHPERMVKFQLQDLPLSKNIRKRFIDEVKKSMKHQNENH